MYYHVIVYRCLLKPMLSEWLISIKTYHRIRQKSRGLELQDHGRWDLSRSCMKSKDHEKGRVTLSCLPRALIIPFVMAKWLKLNAHGPKEMEGITPLHQDVITGIKMECLIKFSFTLPLHRLFLFPLGRTFCCFRGFSPPSGRNKDMSLKLSWLHCSSHFSYHQEYHISALIKCYNLRKDSEHE